MSTAPHSPQISRRPRSSEEIDPHIPPQEAPENVIQSQPIPTPRHDQFAQELGFESYLALFETSTPLKSDAVGNWLLTKSHSGQWVVWNAADLQVGGSFSSEEEARQSIDQSSGSA